MNKVESIVDRVANASEEVLVERRWDVKLLVLSVIAGGHTLIEGIPGIAKTLTAKTVAKLLNLRFSRIQLTPDLLPADIVGTKVFNQRTGDFEVVVGPINANLVLADEINRASPRTQSALLEAMQERQVTIEGFTVRLPEPFTVVATMNPVELEGVFPLPEAQLDRFFIKVDMHSLSRNGLIELLKRGSLKIEEVFESLKPVVSVEEILESRRELSRVHVDDSVLDYMLKIYEALNNHRYVRLGVTPRGLMMLHTLAKCLALTDGRDYVIPDDVKAAAVPALSHRVLLKPEVIVEGTSSREVIEEVLRNVGVPRP
ncbi:MAG: MoxR family ATPase [Zestosphaera sp.]